MAKIDLTVFGGLVPKDSARALPADAAQVAHDIESTTSEFRPVGGDTQVVANSGVNNPLTMYRFQIKSDGTANDDFSINWIVSLLRKSYAKGQVNSDITERTYVSTDDGSVPPHAIDNTGEDRVLGVPAPTTAPAITVNVADEFTTEDRSGQIDNILQYLKVSTSALRSPVWQGAPRPGTGTPGYADRDTVPSVPAEPQEGEQLRLFRLSTTGGVQPYGAITSTYAVGGADTFQWAFDAGLSSFFRTAAGSGWPAWAGTTNDHLCIPLTAYGLLYELNGLGLTDALVAMEMPGAAPGTPLLTGDQVDDILDLVEELYNQKYEDVQPKLNALSAQFAIAKTIVEGGTQGANVAAVTAFYTKADVIATINAGVANAAAAMFDAARGAALYTDPS